MKPLFEIMANLGYPGVSDAIATLENGFLKLEKADFSSNEEFQNMYEYHADLDSLFMMTEADQIQAVFQRLDMLKETLFTKKSDGSTNYDILMNANKDNNPENLDKALLVVSDLLDLDIDPNALRHKAEPIKLPKIEMVKAEDQVIVQGSIQDDQIRRNEMREKQRQELLLSGNLPKAPAILKKGQWNPEGYQIIIRGFDSISKSSAKNKRYANSDEADKFRNAVSVLTSKYQNYVENSERLTDSLATLHGIEDFLMSPFNETITNYQYLLSRKNAYASVGQQEYDHIDEMLKSICDHFGVPLDLDKVKAKRVVADNLKKPQPELESDPQPEVKSEPRPEPQPEPQPEPKKTQKIPVIGDDNYPLESFMAAAEKNGWDPKTDLVFLQTVHKWGEGGNQPSDQYYTMNAETGRLIEQSPLSQDPVEKAQQKLDFLKKLHQSLVYMHAKRQNEILASLKDYESDLKKQANIKQFGDEDYPFETFMQKAARNGWDAEKDRVFLEAVYEQSLGGTDQNKEVSEKTKKIGLRIEETYLYPPMRNVNKKKY